MKIEKEGYFMDALDFLNEFNRMCKYFKKDNNCTICPLYDKNAYILCKDIKDYDPKYVLDVVEKWSKEHPKRTYLSVLLEKFPKTNLCNGIPRFCICNLGFDYYPFCTDDCKICWNKEYKEK